MASSEEVLSEAEELLLVSKSEFYALVREVERQGRVLDQLARFLPAMEKAAAFLDNPAGKFRDMARFRKGTDHG